MNFQQIVMLAASTVTDVVEAGALGPELVQNGDMSSSTGWSLSDDSGVGGTLVISGGKMTATDATPDEGQNAQQNPTLEAATYRVVFTIDSISGTGATVTPQLGDAPGTARTAPGTYSQDLANTVVGVSSFLLTFTGSDWVTVLDNASVKKVL
jgi:hypothetical protein